MDAAIVAWMVIMTVNQYIIIGKQVEIVSMLKRGTLPESERKIPMLELVTTAVRAVRARHIKNNGAPVVPDVPEWMMTRFVTVLLREIANSASIEDVKLTEPVWVAGGKFRDLVGGSPAQFRACIARLEAARIVTRGDRRGARVWSMPYRSINSKLRSLLPVAASPTAKTAGNRG